MTDEAVHIELEHLKRVRLEPDDVIVVHHPEAISNADARRLSDYLSAMFPGNKNVILASGAQIGVVRPGTVYASAPDNSPEAVVERYRAAGGLNRP